MDTVVQEAIGPDPAESTRAQFGALLQASRYAEIADECREILGPSRFAAVLRTQLDKAVSPPEATHRPIVRTPYASIVTTNFDTLLEDAYGLWSDEGVPKCPTGAQLGRHGTLLLDRTFFVLKAHGTIRDASSLVFTSEDYRRIIHANPAFQSMMAAILLSHAVVFVGYSLGDPNFRLLLDSQLSVFGAHAPPRYALMEGVSAVESQILRRTAGIEAISFPPGEFECVATFLSTLAEATQPPPSARGVPMRVLRERTPLPALCLAIRPRDAMLDVEWFETTTDDLEGVRVPRERRFMASASSLPWVELWAKLSDASEFQGTFPRATIDAVGSLLARPLEQLKLPLLSAGEPRLVMLDIPDELAAIPWEWIRTERGPLGLQAPVCRTVPGFDDASRGRPFFHAPLRVLVIGDALSESPQYHHRLPGTREEAEEIFRLFKAASALHDVTLLVGREASYERVLRELTDGHDIVHLTGVAYVDDDESMIPLHDGRVRRFRDRDPPDSKSTWSAVRERRPFWVRAVVWR
jgi:SIR2-like domain/CHAT domain